MRAPRPPILADKHHVAPSVFTPESLLREARRQKGLAAIAVPEVCVLDPDGDLVRHLVLAGRAKPSPGWACYHTALHTVAHEGLDYGVVGVAVGGPFAVLVAEELFASGCRLLVSVTSAGQIAPVREPPYFVLIDRALRDEGTSYHYLPPSDFSEADPALIRRVGRALRRAGMPVEQGPSWTTDAPFRETAAAIEGCQARGVLAVEMEAAALYAFARARGRPVVCFAHVTNRMGRAAGDFEKGEADGTQRVLGVIAATARAWRRRPASRPAGRPQVSGRRRADGPTRALDTAARSTIMRRPADEFPLRGRVAGPGRGGPLGLRGGGARRLRDDGPNLRRPVRDRVGQSRHGHQPPGAPARGPS